jgi:hypothetical protein
MAPKWFSGFQFDTSGKELKGKKDSEHLKKDGNDG